MSDPNIIMKPMNNQRRAPAGTHTVQSGRQNRSGPALSLQVRRTLTCPAQTAFAVRVSSHLPVGNSVDPAHKTRE